MDAPAARTLHPLEDPRFREALARMVRRRVPESDAEDIVQTAIAEAIVAGKRDEDPDALRRWVWGVARHKVVDHFRRRRRLADELPDVADETTRYDELDLLRWARRELPAGENAEETLRWMLREADGETLETIAEESNVPAPRVRKRVSRLREHFRARWSGQVAALVALGVVVIVIAVVALRKRGDDIAKDLPLPAPSLAPSAREPSPRELAEEKRREAFERCEEGSYRPCLELLDQARQVDPSGDKADAVQRARKAATDALNRVGPAPSVAPTAPPETKDFKGKVAPTASAFTPTPLPPPSPKKSASDPSVTPSPMQTEAPPRPAPPTKAAPSKRGPMKPSGSSGSL